MPISGFLVKKQIFLEYIIYLPGQRYNDLVISQLILLWYWVKKKDFIEFEKKNVKDEFNYVESGSGFFYRGSDPGQLQPDP